MADSMNVHDIVQRDEPLLTTGGQLLTKRTVTFYVGTHGPFRLEYDRAEATAEKIAHDIQSQVVELRNVQAAFGGGQV